MIPMWNNIIAKAVPRRTEILLEQPNHRTMESHVAAISIAGKGNHNILNVLSSPVIPI